MRAYWISPGPTGTAVELRKTAAPEPKAGEILVRVRAASLKATEGKGVNLVVNNVGGSMFAEGVKILAFEGRLATVGHLDHVLSATLDIEALHRTRLTVFGVRTRWRTAGQRAETVRAFARDVLPSFEDGRLRPLVDRVFGFDELPKAIAFMESDAQVGKIVVRV
jgi:NADPH2:quinone reductase